MANDTPYDGLQRRRDVAREFGKPVARVPDGGALEGLVARLEKTDAGGFRAIVVGERYVAVIGLHEDAGRLVGKSVRLENTQGLLRLVAHEQSIERGR